MSQRTNMTESEKKYYQDVAFMHGEKNKAIARLMALPAQLPLPDHMQPNGAQGPWLGHAPVTKTSVRPNVRLLQDTQPASNISTMWRELGVQLD